MPTGWWAKMFHLSGQYILFPPPSSLAPFSSKAPMSISVSKTPGSELCKYLCKQMRANQINQIQCSLTTSQRSPSRQTPPFHSVLTKTGRLGDWGWYIYSLGNARQLGNQRKLELPMVAAMWLQFH